jgi:hypothetical protein
MIFFNPGKRGERSLELDLKAGSESIPDFSETVHPNDETIGFNPKLSYRSYQLMK